MLNVVGIVFLVLILTNFLISTFLTVLNLRHLRGKAASLPGSFEPYIDYSTYRKSRAYNA